MPAILTNRMNRRGEGTPRVIRFRITWPDDTELQNDSEKRRLSKLFILEMRDDQSEKTLWQHVDSYTHKAQAQQAAAAEAGHSIKDSDWHTAEE